MLALVGLVAAQLPEVVPARKGQLGARSRVLRCRLGGGAGQHREVVEGLCRAAPPGRQGCRSPDDLHQVAPQQVKIGRVVVPPLHHRNAEGRQIFQQHVTHPVQLPPCPRLVAGQAGAELLLDQIVRLIEAGADLRVGRKALPGAGIPQGAEQILPQAGQQHPLAPQGRKRHPLFLPEGMAARHQQAGRVGPQGGAGQHRSRRAQIHHKARVQLALLHTIGHGIVFQQAEPHLNVGVLLAELVQLGLQPGQVVRHQRDTDADAHRLGRLDLRMEGRLHLLELLHHRGRMALQTQPPLGERKLVVGADEQRAAELGFQRRDALPQGLPRQKQPL